MTGYAKSIGRVGALAVALGAGLVIATATPAIGYAETGDAGPSASDSDSGSSPNKPDTTQADTNKPDTSKPDAAAGDTPAADATDTKKRTPGTRTTRAKKSDTPTVVDDTDSDAKRSTSVAAQTNSSRSTESTALDDVPAAATRLLSTATSALQSFTAPVTRALDAADPVTNTAKTADPVGVTTRFVKAALGSASSAGSGDDPGVPSAAALAVLGFVRREIDQQASVNVAPQAAVQQQALALPSAEPGDIINDLVELLASIQQFVTPILLNRTPVATAQQVSTAVGTSTPSTQFVAYDPDGDRMTFTVNEPGLSGGPRNGTVVVNEDGTFVYTPNPGFQGTDTFTVAVQDDTDLHIHGPLNFLDAFRAHRDIATVTVFVGQPDTSVIDGDFSILTYNVAGLPFPISSAVYPRWTNTREISSLANQFDVMNVQEDFSYHWALISNSLFPTQTTPFPPTLVWPLGVPFSDGLNTNAAYPIKRLDRQQWFECTADNCLTPKGFTYSQMQLPGGQTVDVYNLHANTGGGETTEANMLQLTNYIQQNSAGRAVIVTGDFNARYSESQILQNFAASNGLTDAWVELEYGGNTPTNAPDCMDGNDCELLDKVFYRSAPGLTLTPTDYQNRSLEFRNDSDEPLSDHSPVSVNFNYVAENLTG